MPAPLNRRNWIKTTALATGALALLGRPSALSARTGKHTASPAPNNFHEWESTYDLSKRPPLKARLLANENPYGPSPRARKAITEAVAGGNRYGHSEARQLITMLAEKEGVPKEYIMLAPGSSDLLEKVAISRFMGPGNLVSADPAYMSLIKTSQAMNAEWKAVPLTDTYAHDLEAMEAAIDEKTKLVYICNPNNPTGTITPAADLEAFCSRVSERVPVFVDEAYLEFMEEGEDKKSMVHLLNEGKDVIVCRTFSKVHGMAGLRIGYIVALPATLESLRKVHRSNMGLNVTALKGAIASLEDTRFLKDSVKWNNECRKYVCGELEKMGFTYLPSQTSFVLFPIEMEGRSFLDKMLDLGVGVRSFQAFGQSHCRVSMGTMDEMKLFVASLREVLV